MSRRLLASRRGAGQVRNLLFLLFLIVVAYYGMGIGTVYLRAFRMEREMTSLARQASETDDRAIRRRLVDKAQSLGLPESARRFMIQRRVRPREIVIRTSWQEELELPFTKVVVTLNPTARAPL